MQQHNLEPNLVTWVPTPNEIVTRMLQLAEVSSGDIVCDLGCGDARILVSAARDFGARRAVGYELIGDLCSASRELVCRLDLQDRIEIVNGDLRAADLSDASVVTLYLTSEANRILAELLRMGLRPGARVVTYLFPISGWLPAREIDLNTATFEEGRFIGKLYLYRMPPALM
jgi:precorrin-6B methylase 2